MIMSLNHRSFYVWLPIREKYRTNTDRKHFDPRDYSTPCARILVIEGGHLGPSHNGNIGLAGLEMYSAIYVALWKSFNILMFEIFIFDTITVRGCIRAGWTAFAREIRSRMTSLRNGWSKTQSVSQSVITPIRSIMDDGPLPYRTFYLYR